MVEIYSNVNSNISYDCQCVDAKRSPKLLRQPHRWQQQHATSSSLRLRHVVSADVSEERPPRVPGHVQLRATCRAAKSPSLPVIPRLSTRCRQDTASR